MARGLRLGANLDLPLAAVTEPIGIFANRGKGKSSLVRRFVEQLYRAGLPSVVLDIKGDWWGIRASADGKADGGLPFLIFGGEHGDVPLEEHSGPIVARFLAEHRVPAVIDLSGFSKTKARRWTMNFAEALYAASREPLAVVVDEADVLIPQRPSPEFYPLLGAMEDIAKRGRQRGLGIVVASQRVQDVNKSVTELLETLFLGAITGPRMRRAIEEWIDDHADRDEARDVIATLSTLDVGEFWVWSPGFLRLLARVRADLFETWDSFRTPEPGQARRVPRSLAAVDLGRLSAEIAATVERAKADDPAELRARLRAVEAARDAREAMLERARQALVATGYFDAGQVDGDVAPRIVELAQALARREPERVEVSVLPDTVGERLEKVVAEFGRISGDVLSTAEQISAALRRVHELPAAAKEGQAGNPAGSSAPRQRQVPHTPTQRSRVRGESVPPNTAGKTRPGSEETRPPAPAGTVVLKDGARRMLTALAQHHPLRLTRAQVATMGKVKISGGTFSTYWSTLRRAGLIDETALDVGITDAGFAALGTVPSFDSAGLLEHYRRILKSGARRMLDVLVDAHPGPLSKAELAERAEIEQSGGTFSTYLSLLRRNGLVVDDGPTVRAADVLFLGGAA